MNSKTVLSSLHYTFSPATRTITFDETIGLKAQDIVLVVNLTTSNIIYNFACSTEGGVFLNNTLTLVYNTTSMSSSDKLSVVIFNEDKKEAYLKEILDVNTELNEKLTTLLNINTEESILGDIIREKLEELRPHPTTNYHISGAAATHVIDVGRGFLKKVIFNTPTNNIVTIYDNDKASESVIAIIDPSTQTDPFELGYELDYYTGLTVVTAGTPDITIIINK